MKNAMIVLSVLLVALLVAAVTFAESYNEGYVNDDGYTYNAKHALWWKDGYFYERYQTTAYRYESRCDYRGCSYQVKVPYTVWKYRRAAIRDVVTEKDPDMHIKFLELMMARDKYIGQERSEVVKTDQFERLLEMTGMYQNFRVEGYGEPLGYGNYDPLFQDSGYDQTLAPQGNTQYGYSGFNETYTVSKGVDLDQWRARRQQLQETDRAYAAADSERLDYAIENIASTHSEIMASQLANQELRATISEMRTVVTELAKLRQAMGQAGKEVEVHQRREWQKSPMQTQPAPLMQQSSLLPQVQTIADRNCGACHGGDTAKGEFHLEELAVLDLEGRKHIWELIDQKKMPKKLEGEDEPRWLTLDEKAVVAQWVIHGN